MNSIFLLLLLGSVGAPSQGQSDSSKTQLFQAVRDGNLSAVKAMLAKNKALVNAKTQGGLTVVTLASYYFEDDIVKLLLTHKPKLDFHSAVAAGEARAVQSMLSKNPALKDRMTVDGTLPLCMAAAFKRREVLRVLLSHKPDVNKHSKEYDQVAALNSAVFGRDLECVKMLIEAGANVDIASAGGFVPLHESASKGDLAIVKLLVASGADVRRKTPDGKTPLALAEAAKHKEVITYLKSMGA